MKKIIFLVAMLWSVAYAQTPSKIYIRGDSIYIQKVNGNATLIIENSTRNVTGGVLTNIGNGRTAFVLPTSGSVDSIWREPGKDSIKFIKNGVTYAIKDSTEGPIPTLQAVTTAGNLTTNAIKINGNTNLTGEGLTLSYVPFFSTATITPYSSTLRPGTLLFNTNLFQVNSDSIGTSGGDIVFNPEGNFKVNPGSAYSFKVNDLGDAVHLVVADSGQGRFRRLRIGTGLDVSDGFLNSSGGMTNPMTTEGDIIYSSDGSGTPARLGIGSDGDHLQVVSGAITWAPPGTGSNIYNSDGYLTGPRRVGGNGYLLTLDSTKLQIRDTAVTPTGGLHGHLYQLNGGVDLLDYDSSFYSQYTQNSLSGIDLKFGDRNNGDTAYRFRIGLSGYRFYNVPTGTISSFYGQDASGNLVSAAADEKWSLVGNTITAGVSTGSFLGSTNNVSLRFRTNNIQRVIIDSNLAQIRIGGITAGTSHALMIKGLTNGTFDGISYENLAASETFTFGTQGINSTSSMYRVNQSSNNLQLNTKTTVGGSNTPTARLEIAAGSATANTAPLEFNSGAVETTPRAGLMEFNDAYYLTNTALNRIGLPGVIYSSSATVPNSGTSATTLSTYTTKASTLAATDAAINFEYFGTSNDANVGSTMVLSFAGTTIATLPLTSGVSTWNIKGNIVRTGASTATATIHYETTTIQLPIVFKLTGLTFTNTNILLLTGTALDGNADGIVKETAEIRWRPAPNN